MTDGQPSPNMRLWLCQIGWDGEVALATQVSLSEELRWVRGGFAISCWCARALHYIIHMLHNTLAERHTHLPDSHTQTHMPGAKLGLPWMSLLQMFLLRQFPRLLQSMCCFRSCIMCLHMIVHDVCICYLCFLQTLQPYSTRRKQRIVYISAGICFSLFYTHAHTPTYAHI